MDSFVKNSIVIGRDDGEPIFIQEPDVVRARLDGYVIVPKEMIGDVDGFLAGLRVVPDESALAV